MIHTLFIINNHGEIIIERHWRGRVSRQVGEQFWEEVQKADSFNDVSPVIVTQKYYIMHIFRANVFFVAVLHGEVPPLMVTELLHRIVDTFEDYFVSVSEDILKQNFVTVYQLLDEMIDNGFPITTEPAVLKELVIPPSLPGRIFGAPGVMGNLPEYSVSAVPWRRNNVRYTNNEVFFDLVEEMDCIIDSNGATVSCEILGHIQANCRLSGMPDLLLTFANPSILDDVAFHPCVRYAKYEQDRSLSFVPPDGAFELMSYRAIGLIQAPVYVKPQITLYEGGGRINIMAGTRNTMGKPVDDFIVVIPLPKCVDAVNVKATPGHAVFDPVKKELKWDIGKMTPKQEASSLTGTLSIQHGAQIPDSTPTVMVNFKLPMVASSGLKIDSVQLLNERYKPYKGVRAMTKAGKFQVRTS